MTPPKLPLRFLRWFCHPDLLPSIEGDLIELFEEKTSQNKNRFLAYLYFTKEVIKLFRPGITKKLEGSIKLNSYGMFKNYFKVGIRNILKYKIFSFINVFGLAVAMSVCMLIMLMLSDQKRSDQFHEKKDRIYRVIGHTSDSALPYASTAVPLASKLKVESPSVEDVTHLLKGVGGDVSYNNRSQEMRGFFTGPEFFNVFSFTLEEGDHETALKSPQSIVITSSLAERLFKKENPLGKIVQFSDRNLDIIGMGSKDNLPVDWGSFTVTGVLSDQGYSSHLKFDVLVSESSTKKLSLEKKLADLSDNWTNYYSCYSYVLLKPKSTVDALMNSLNSIVKANYSEEVKQVAFKLDLQKLGEISPGPFMAIPVGLRMPIEAYYALGAFGIIIMLLACLNYINISIARALTRAKEIGIRKVNGGTRRNIVYQFFCESLITASLSLIMAIAILSFLKNAFTSLWLNNYINFNLQLTSDVYLPFLTFTLIIAVVIGLYPALYMSRFSPIGMLRNTLVVTKRKFGLRKALNTSQFTVSLFFIVTSLVIYNQLKHFLAFEYGFETEHILNVPLQSNEYQIMATELSSVKGVSAISACSFIPASGGGNGQFLREVGNEKEHLLFTLMSATENYLDNLGLQTIAGQNIPARRTSADRFVVINAFAAAQLGYESSSEAIGKILEFKNWNEQLEIVGVVQDFQFKSLFEDDKNAPLIIRNRPEDLRHLNVSISSNSPMQTIEQLNEKWEEIDPIHGFKYEFFDEQLASMNFLFKDIVAIIGFITILAVVISALGLLGMSIYTTERRTKEIGIRKTLGAGVRNIVLLLSREFVLLLGISILLAAPLSYYANGFWLNSIANRIDFSIETVLVGSTILFGIGLFTISFQTLRAAKQNPVESLKDE